MSEGGIFGHWIEKSMPSIKKPWLLEWPEATVGISAELMAEF